MPAPIAHLISPRVAGGHTRVGVQRQADSASPSAPRVGITTRILHIDCFMAVSSISIFIGGS
ncbi:MAG: hypothetical protein MUF00_20740, partial [Gemmatimonadaceae bacterium]|nr:hypothetical protein [Gemmatimonadaceae bacterium]